MSEKEMEIWLIRHGETEWSAAAKHTGSTDVPLNARGRKQASALQQFLAGKNFDLVLSSPRMRAMDTCRLAGLGDVMQIEPDLAEWNYGDFEGLTTAQIRESRPGWSVWDGPVTNGETLEQVGARADTVIARAIKTGGRTALFAHAHILRILGACWISMTPAGGQHLRLDAATVSVLAFERESRVIQHWNCDVDEG